MTLRIRCELFSMVWKTLVLLLQSCIPTSSHPRSAWDFHRSSNIPCSFTLPCFVPFSCKVLLSFLTLACRILLKYNYLKSFGTALPDRFFSSIDFMFKSSNLVFHFNYAELKLFPMSLVDKPVWLKSTAGKALTLLEGLDTMQLVFGRTGETVWQTWLWLFQSSEWGFCVFFKCWQSISSYSSVISPFSSSL